MNLQKPFLFLVLICTSYVVAYDGKKKLQNYIVTFKAKDGERGETWHKSILSSITKDDPESRHIYSYHTVANGFAARLADDEVQALKDYPGCALIIPAHEPLQLQTTHTPQFLGLRGSNGLWKRTKNMGEGIIIGVLDSGIAPGHPSFDDKGMSPPPAKWKGHCDFNSTICNNKLIGAKTMLKAGADEKKHIPPIDTTAHGTHTASTAAGNFVKNVTFLGVSMGKASGIAPRAHIAVYKVCNELGCQSADLLKAYEEAVNDGCDVLSVSVGSTKPMQLFDSVHSVASFYAISKGVFVSSAAGNLGPTPSTIFSGDEAPWLLTVGSSTTDRRFRSTVKLGNGVEMNGESVYQPTNWTSKMLPLIYITGDGANANASQCLNGTLDKELVRGKIVVCDDDGITPTGVKSVIVRDAGGAGMIVANTEMKQFYSTAEPNALPASDISYVDGMKIKDYIHSTKQPTATFLFKGLVYHDNFSPSITMTSSRGPSLHTPLILKPDIAGPGVSILAAAPSYLMALDDKSKSFLLMTGTSMAAPHLSGIAAIIKRANPNWSPAAIKSAIMTTAHITDIDGKPIVLDHTHSPANAFDMGAGHVDPNKALDPGLVYDIDIKEYVSYLCGLGFKDEEVNNIIYPEPDVECAKVKVIPEEQLNYPSIGVSLPIPLHGNNSTSSIDKTIYRTVTNVGKATNATYKATISVPKGVSAEVVPSTLRFESLNEKKTFKIVLKQQGRGGGSTGFGELKWVSGRYSVRSPIVLFFK